MIVDEEFNKVTSSLHMGAVQVQPIGGAMQKQPLTGLNQLTVRRGGWLYVYVSNESNQDVYFDDLVINHKRGPVVETNSYYAFGMEIPGLNAKAIGFGTSPQNRAKYNGASELQSKEFSDGSGLETYDTHFRQLDPQLGRWWQIDPKPNMGESPYTSMSNNPVRFNDPLGDIINIKNNSTDAGKEGFIKIVNGGTGGYYETKIGEDGKVTLVATGKEGKMTKQQGKFYKQIMKAIDSKTNIGITVVSGTKIEGGSYFASTIDVGDFLKVGNGSIINSASFVAHELAEQKYKQENGFIGLQGFDKAHEIAMDAEKEITGWRRKEYLTIDKTKTDASGQPYNYLKFVYSNGNQNQGFVFIIVNGNYVSVTPEKK